MKATTFFSLTQNVCQIVQLRQNFHGFDENYGLEWMYVLPLCIFMSASQIVAFRILSLMSSNLKCHWTKIFDKVDHYKTGLLCWNNQQNSRWCIIKIFSSWKFMDSTSYIRHKLQSPHIYSSCLWCWHCLCLITKDQWPYSKLITQNIKLFMI